MAYLVTHRPRADGPAPALDRPDLRRTDIVLRMLDLLIAATVLLLTSPLLVVFALAIRLSSGSPVLYRGERVGRDGIVYGMYKFRTLARDAETRLGKYYGPELTIQTALEVTRLGRIMRATQLDELPQLFNVLKGDMSVVGPRPIRPVFFDQLSEQIPAYWQRLVIRPGLTGFAQMRMGREETWAEKLSHDLEYIADRSVGLYLVVAITTGARLVKQSIVDSVALVARRR